MLLQCVWWLQAGWLLPQVRISRKRILESAAKIFEMYGTSRAVLEIEYFGEVLPPCRLLSF